MLGLHCCVDFFSSWGFSLSLWWLLLLWNTVSSLVGFSHYTPRFLITDSEVVAHGLSCSEARGVFLDQGSNPSPLLWQVDSLPLSHKGSPLIILLKSWLAWFQTPQLKKRFLIDSLSESFKSIQESNEYMFFQKRITYLEICKDLRYLLANLFISYTENKRKESFPVRNL